MIYLASSGQFDRRDACYIREQQDGLDGNSGGELMIQLCRYGVEGTRTFILCTCLRSGIYVFGTFQYLKSIVYPRYLH